MCPSYEFAELYPPTTKMEDDISDMSRPQMYLFGCTLKSDKREFKVDLDGDETEQQLSLKAVCLGAEAEDKFHMVEVEGLTYDGKTTKVPLAVLKPSVLPSMSLGGFEITPPVTFRLQSGSGPVYISGQHFISVKESDDEEEENNSSPVKRPANLLAGKKPPMVVIDIVVLHCFKCFMFALIAKLIIVYRNCSPAEVVAYCIAFCLMVVTFSNR
uniref:Nucleophosmin n=1 Tax=Pundamilia nyererei TaxID=303518 RepID=A0A3B4EWS1_9CICH